VIVVVVVVVVCLFVCLFVVVVCSFITMHVLQCFAEPSSSSDATLSG